jgi:hypothetical protein
MDDVLVRATDGGTMLMMADEGCDDKGLVGGAYAGEGTLNRKRR